MSEEKTPQLSAADDELSVEELEEVNGGAAALNGYKCVENGSQCSCPSTGISEPTEPTVSATLG